MSFDDLYLELQQYYTLFLNEAVIKVRDDLRIIITRLLYMMKEQWDNECIEEI